MATEDTDRIDRQLVDAIRGGQALVVDAARGIATAVSDSIPETAKAVGIDGVPSPTPVITSAFDVVDKVLDIQRDVTKTILDVALAPLAGVLGDRDADD